MSFFHCFPRDAFEMQDIIISGEELETKVKAKAISGSVVNKLYEQKLGIAMDANMLVDQAYNFWQYNCFMFGDDSWLATKMSEVYNTIQTFKPEIHSIARNEKDYITLLASQINNDYHLFLSSCLDADDDMDKVSWNYIDHLSGKIKELVKNRSKPNFVMTRMVRALAEQSRIEIKRKQEADENANKTGLTPPRKTKRQERNKNRVRFHDDTSDDNNSDDREVDP
jgi:hypothetical protein